MKNTKIYQRFKKFLDTLKPMTWGQRIDHVWTYYKDIIIVTLVLLIIPISLLLSTINNKEVIFGGMVINYDMRKSGVEYLSDDLFVKLDGNPKKQKVNLNANMFEQYASDIDSNYKAAMSTMGYINAGILDYLIMDEFAMELYIPERIYMDLSLIFTQEELEQFGDKVIYARPEDSEISTPISLNITDMVFVQDCLNVEDAPVYLSFVGPDENAAQYRAFWDYLIAWEETEYHQQLQEQKTTE